MKQRRSWLRRLLGASMLLAIHTGLAPAAEAASSAVIVMYHRFGETNHPSTNIGLQQFEAHLRILRTEGYTVLPVPEILAAVQAGHPLPDKTVGITIDDAYASVYREAWPRLREAGLPFTLFVSTDAIDEGLGGFMNWQQIRELRDAGVVIGGHSASHGHLAAKDIDAVVAELNRANASYNREIGGVPTLFAFPYGETSQVVTTAVRDAGFSIAFGQHSGVVHGGVDMFYLPRFALSESYGDEGRFRMVTQTLPMPVADITPADPTLQTNPPAFGFTLTEDFSGQDRLACYASGQGETVLERLGPRVEVRVSEAFRKGRARINCTAPGVDGRWHWFGMQFYVPGAVARAAD